jgi:hypothetical protein
MPSRRRIAQYPDFVRELNSPPGSLRRFCASNVHRRRYKVVQFSLGRTKME